MWKFSPHYCRTVRHSAYCTIDSHLFLYFWTPSTALRSQTSRDRYCIDCVELCFVWVDTVWFSKGILLVSTYLLWITLLFFDLQNFFWKNTWHTILRDFSYIFNEPSVLFVFNINIYYFFNWSIVKQGVFQWIALESDEIFFYYFKQCFHIPSCSQFINTEA